MDRSLDLVVGRCAIPIIFVVSSLASLVGMPIVNVDYVVVFVNRPIVAMDVRLATLLVSDTTIRTV